MASACGSESEAPDARSGTDASSGAADVASMGDVRSRTDGGGQRVDASPDDSSDTGIRDDVRGRDVGGNASTDGGDAAIVPGPCVEPTSGMIVTEDTALCAGTHEMEAVGPDEAAIRIGGDDVTVACRGTHLTHAGDVAKRDKPNAAFLVDNWSGVEIRGCRVEGFRYGLIARKTEELTVADVDFRGNFDDPDKRRVFNPVNGGGIRLEGARGGVVRNSRLGDNWNGIALSDSRGVEIRNNQVASTSNSGLSILGSRDNLVVGNDISKSVRGDDLSFPDTWYGENIKKTAGIIVDSRSTENRIVDNRITRSGDGVAIRSVTGFCATDNLVKGNTFSEIAHRAVDSTCDDHRIVDNDIRKSRFGIWLEGTSGTVVRGNQIRDSRVDGVSIQRSDNRHVEITGNTIAGSGRAGLLVSGRTYRARHDLSRQGQTLANASHVLVQRNTFRNNTDRDVFVSSARSVLLASNCGGNGGIDLKRGSHTDFVETTGDCRDQSNPETPDVRLDMPSSARTGDSVSFEPTNLTIPKNGSTPTHRWLVQSARATFQTGLPPVVAGGREGGAIRPTFSKPGMYDVSLTVDDGRSGAMAWDRIAVLPSETLRGTSASEWGYGCAKGDEKPIQGPGKCSTTISDDSNGLQKNAVHVRTDASYDFEIYTPGKGALDLDVTGRDRLGFFVKALNPNGRGWQGGPFPRVELEGDGGSIVYSPTSQRLPVAGDHWRFVSIPLDGGDGWKRSDRGGSLDDVDRIALRADTWGWDAVDIWIDGLVFY
jgi:parallel beta-helix repeat protein